MLEQLLPGKQDQMDKRATRKRVESLLETARISQSLSAVRRDNSQSAGGIAESFGGYGVRNDELLCSKVEEALSRLDDQEQAIIRERYMQKAKTYDYLLCYELHMSERTYRRVKARAMEKLVYMLGAEVFR